MKYFQLLLLRIKEHHRRCDHKKKAIYLILTVESCSSPNIMVNIKPEKLGCNQDAGYLKIT